MHVPTIHYNGTSKDELIAQLAASAGALRQAMSTMEKACPHPRDYYIQHAAVWPLARGEHDRRVARVRGVLDEIYEILDAIYEQE
jgi:hypothetical protein